MKGETIFLCLVNIFVIGQGQQEDNRLFFVESCPTRPCPVDCERRYNPRGCPSCQCPEGQRCPAIECPVQNNLNAICQVGQKMDGCQTCVCDRRTHSIYYKESNLERFLIGNGIPGSKETCRTPDAAQITGCLRPLRDFHQNFMRRNPTLTQSMYPWLYFELHEFGELCEMIQRLPICTGLLRMDRCKDQQPELTAMYTMYNLPCNEEQDSFFDHFNCLHNIMVSHFALRFCESRLDLEIRKASRGRNLSVANKRRIKCLGLNDFINCTKPTMQRHCGIKAQELFRDSVTRAASVTAPECTVEYGSFKPVRTEPINFKFRGNKNGHPRPPLSSRRIDHQNFPKPWRPTFVPLSPDGVGTRSTTLAPSRRRERTQNLRVDAKSATFRQRDLPVGLVAYHDEKGVIHMRGRCERVPARHSCPQGSTPQIVIRWHRQPGETICTTYKYDYCGADQERLDLPIRYEESCYDLCFKEEEKNNFEHIRNIKFRNGFQIENSDEGS